MPPLVFFDVDKTLLKGYSGFYTTLLLIQKGILKKRRILQALYYRLIGPIREGTPSARQSLQRMYEIAIQDMAGSSLDDVLKIGRECFDRWIRPRLYRQAIEAVEEHKKKGHPIYLMTSGPYMTLQILGDFLGVDARYSAGPVIRNNILTSELRLPICYREGKVEAAEDALKRHGAQWKDCYYYGDSADDIFLLEKVGHPRAVNPDPVLQKTAQERDWSILTFRHCLGRSPEAKGSL